MRDITTNVTDVGIIVSLKGEMVAVSDYAIKQYRQIHYCPKEEAAIILAKKHLGISEDSFDDITDKDRLDFQERIMETTADPKYSLAVRAVKAIIAHNGSDKIKSDNLVKLVEVELKKNDYNTATDELKAEVIEELVSILHWMHRKGIVSREDDPNDEDGYVWGRGSGKQYKSPRRPRNQLRGLPDNPLDTTPETVLQMGGPTYNPLADRIKILEQQIRNYAEVVEQLADEVEQTKKLRKVEYVINTNGKQVKIKEKVHKIFPEVLFHLECGDIPMLVGPSGCGKTKLAMQVANHLKMRFGLLSWHGGMTESQLYGKTIPNITGGKEVYIPAEFADFFENGGLYLHDEIDGGDPNVLLSLNAPFSNGKMKLPRKVNPLVTMHKGFRCIATANTWGNGADRHYVGRNQMDGATIKRFTLISMDYDEDLEVQLCPGAEDMVRRLQDYRLKIISNKIQRVMDTRFVLRAYNWVRHKKDDDFIDRKFFEGWREDEIRKVKGI